MGQQADDNKEWWRVECAAGIWIEGRIGTGGGGEGVVWQFRVPKMTGQEASETRP